MNRPPAKPVPPSADVGLRCRGCGCPHVPIVGQRESKLGVQTLRICRHCGRRLVAFQRRAA